MPAAPPPLTVGLPVYNGERYLDTAIHAIRRQTFCDFEFLLSDNGSTDATQAICQQHAADDHRIVYHRHDQNRGAAFNFNFVVEQARGDLFKWMAHDDDCSRDYVQRCVEALLAPHVNAGPRTTKDTQEPIVAAFARRRFMTPDGTVLPRTVGTARGDQEPLETMHDLSYRQLLCVPPRCGPVPLFGVIRTQALRQTRGLGAYPSADTVLMAELRLQGRLVEVPEDMYHQRLHPDEERYRKLETRQGNAEYYDPRNAGRFIPPTRLKMAVEHLRAIHHAPIALSRKAAAVRDYVYWLGWNIKRPKVRSPHARQEHIAEA